MTSRSRLLVVDDEPDLCKLYELTLLREGHDVECAGTLNQARTQLAEGTFDVVITDMRLPDGTGLELLRGLEVQGRPEKIVVITAYGSAANAVEVLKAGAFDYLTKPVDLRQFRAVVASALGRTSALPGREVRPVDVEGAPRPGRPTFAQGAQRSEALSRLAGASPPMEQVRELIHKVARSMAPVMITGESGTGKELVARAIHQVSDRADRPFVAVNCGAIPEALLEAEFFGYRKGAFTGAHEDREGFFAAAQGGTLFLDEIGELPMPMQSKLLRAVQERAVRPLGGTTEVTCNFRLLSATHRDLPTEAQTGRFRQDLFYRLNVIPIAVPPLRDRPQDLPAICEAVLQRIAQDAGVDPVPSLTQEALARLARHTFPGNVRELENVLHRALALSGKDWIDRDDLDLDDSQPEDPAPPSSSDQHETPVTGAWPVEPVLPTDLVAYLDEIERQVLERALHQHRFNRTAAGASLGLSLRQMRYRMARLGLAGTEAAEGAETRAGSP